MASLADTIELVFKGKDDVSQVLGKVEGGLDTFGKASGRVVGPLKEITGGLAIMEAGMATLAAVIVAKAIAAAAEFEKALYLVDKQLKDSGGVSVQQTQAIQDLALSYGQSANDVATSMGGFLAAGYDFEQSATLIKSSLSLMIAGEMSAAEATDAIKMALAGFNIPAKRRLQPISAMSSIK